MSQTSQVYAHLNEPAEKPEASRFSEASGSFTFL